MKKKYSELNKLEKKIALRKYKKTNSTFVFPVFISLIISGIINKFDTNSYK